MAFGTLTQLVLENAPVEEIETVAALCHAVGLPITRRNWILKKISRRKCGLSQRHLVLKVKPSTTCRGATPDQVYAALLVADQYGQRFLQEWE